ncbi:hypothetical protein ACNI65_11670 [Roseateles sp. So40a]|uniref:hypothetical protein n=1 Tax=Roseateles sp. So40a TaxID=3400226 RepID=UPI003A87D692
MAPLLQSTLIRVAIVLGVFYALKGLYLSGEVLPTMAGMMICVGLAAIVLPRAVIEIASAIRQRFREAHWADDEGRWRVFRGASIMVREHQGDLWIRADDVAKAWESPLPPDEPARVRLPQARGDFARLSLVRRVLSHQPTANSDPRHIAFIHWLDQIQTERSRR